MSMTERDFEIVEGWLREAMEFGEENHNEPYEKAIKALSEFRELKEKKYDCEIKHLVGECSYAETGCSDCIGKLKIKESLEKATAKKVKRIYEYGIFDCPHCNKVLPVGKKYPHCTWCGGLIDYGWSEGKE